MAEEKTEERIREDLVGDIFSKLSAEKKKFIRPLKKRELQEPGEVAMINAMDSVISFLLSEYNVDLGNYLARVRENRL